MRLVIFWTGNLLLALGALGMLLSTSGQADTWWRRFEAVGPIAEIDAFIQQRVYQPSANASGEPFDGSDLWLGAYAPTAGDGPYRGIDAVQIPRIGLEAEVVPAHLAHFSQGVTWEVPPFKVGHADGTAGAGNVGNAILLGHVTSRSVGNVFLKLDQVRVGDRVVLATEGQDFAYEVTDVDTVDRTDVSVLRPADAPTVTLLTCTGIWLPKEQDYSNRLAVRARLIE